MVIQVRGHLHNAGPTRYHWVPGSSIPIICFRAQAGMKRSVIGTEVGQTTRHSSVLDILIHTYLGLLGVYTLEDIDVCLFIEPTFNLLWRRSVVNL